MVRKYIICIVLLLFSATSSTYGQKKDFLAENIDSTISPGEDFFMFANGSWFKRNPIPPEEGSWGIWNLVRDDIYFRLKKINEQAALTKSPMGSPEQLIGDFWYAAMDTVTIEKQGLQPLQPDFNKINSINSLNDLIDFVGILHSRNMKHVMFTDFITADNRNSDKSIYVLWPGGLNVGSLDYYFKNDEFSVNIRNVYQQYLFKTFKQLGNDSLNAKKIALSVYTLETKLANAIAKEGGYKKIGFTELKKLTPNINWDIYLNRISIEKLDSLAIQWPDFFTALNSELVKIPLEDWKNTLRFLLVKENAYYLDKTSFRNLFEFNKPLSGQIQQRPRWRNVLNAESDIMIEPLTRLFIKEYFSDKMKQRYTVIIESIRNAFRERIQKLEWMNDSTKQKALEKLSKLKAHLGYPDKWKDFSTMEIKRDAYVLNMIRANQWWHLYDIKKLKEPVDKSEWGLGNGARYDGNSNAIFMEAVSFIIPGVKDEELDDAFVYGYTFAGHEISHGFDSDGKNYDAYGNRTNWWTKKDSTEFIARTKMMVEQYNEFMPIDTLHVNGERTLPENIADLAGLLITLDAFKKTEQYKKNETIGGYTPLQRFFLAYAYRQMGHARKERLAHNLRFDQHAPDKERVNGVVVNIPEFYEAFNIKPGDKMYRPENLRVRIW